MKNESNTRLIPVLILAAVLVTGFVLSPLSGLKLQAASSNNVVASVNVLLTCFAQVSNTAINFGTLTPTTQYSATNVVTVNNGNGNVKANILVDGTSWSSASGNTFGVTNTLWATTSGGTTTPLTNSLVDTLILVPKGGSNSVYFGLDIPAAQNADVYTQTITVESNC